MQFITFLKEKWNILIEMAVIISALIMKFATPPVFEPTSLYDNIDYLTYSQFIVGGLLALSIIPCYFYNSKKFTWRWWIIAIALLIGGVILNFTYGNFKSEFVIDSKTYGYGKIVKGNNYLPEAKIQLNEYKEKNKVLPNEEDILAGFKGENVRIWPKKEILTNTKKIVILYMLTLSAFVLFIIFAIQAIYCLQLKDDVKK